MPRAVKITWIDAFVPPDVWYEDGAFEYEPRMMVSYGWVIHQDRDYYAVASTYDEEAGKYSGVILIPRGCERRIEDVEPTDTADTDDPSPVVVATEQLHGAASSRYRLDYIPDDRHGGG